MASRGPLSPIVNYCTYLIWREGTESVITSASGFDPGIFQFRVEASLSCCHFFLISCCVLCCWQTIFVAKTCFWCYVISVISGVQEDHINGANSCLSASRVNSAKRNVLLFAPVATPLSQSFCIQVIGSNIRILTFRISSY